MTDHFLAKVPILGKFVDERFLEHRRRSSSIAGIVAAILAVVLFEYRFFWDHVWNWDLFAIAITFIVIKMSLFAWFRFRD